MTDRVKAALKELIENAEDRPFPDSLCWRCSNHRTMTGAQSILVICSALPVPDPVQPVLACPAFARGPRS